MLLSAHRAKGLEFDDVVILDGGWDRQSHAEDQDAARRLYYVAMTRARRSLALISMTPRHPIIEGLDDPAVLIRAKSQDALDASGCHKLYQTLNLSEVDLSFAGRLPEGSSTLRALEALSTGDPLQLKQSGDRWYILDQSNVPVGRLAKKFKPPQGAQLLEGHAFAISTRFRTDSAEEFQRYLKRDKWSVVLPELVYET